MKNRPISVEEATDLIIDTIFTYVDVIDVSGLVEFILNRELTPTEKRQCNDRYLTRSVSIAKDMGMIDS